MLVSKVKSRKVLFAIIASVMIIVLIAGVAVALTSKPNPADNPQATETPNPTPTASPQPTTPATPTITINQQDTLPQGYITASQALEIAKPYYTQYAQEHNRTITAIRISYFDSTELANEWLHYSYSFWAVETSFHLDEWISSSSSPSLPPLNDTTHNYWDYLYHVSIRADTGQVTLTEVIPKC